MGSKVEYINLEGLRVDGRRPGEIRSIRFQLGACERADGTCYYEQGNTKVLASVYGPREISSQPRGRKVTENAAITCDVSVATFATEDRRKVGPRDKRYADLCSSIRRTFEAVVFTDLYPNSQIEIFIQVLQNDGGLTTACLTATSLALVDAGIPMQDLLVACTAGHIDGAALADLNTIEINAGGPELPVAVLPKTGRIAFLQMDSKIPVDLFDEVLATAITGCLDLHLVLEARLRAHAQRLLESRGMAHGP
jgi:exosome complex component RRP41